MSDQKYPLATVGGLIISADGEILMIRSDKWNNLYTLPGGKIELGETRKDAFIREIKEETNLEITNIRSAIVQDCVYSSSFYKRMHFIMNDFVADIAPGNKKTDVILNNEGSSYMWVNPFEAKKLPSHQEVYVLLDWFIENKESIKEEQNLGVIGFEHYLIRCIIGVNSDERINEQDIYVDIKVETDFSPIALTDNVEDTINYVVLASVCSEVAQKGKYQLIETLAWNITEKIINDFKINWVWIKIKKPQALNSADFTMVELKRYSQK